jgi:hypothetical protein
MDKKSNPEPSHSSPQSSPEATLAAYAGVMQAIACAGFHRKGGPIIEAELFGRLAVPLP